MPDPSPATAPAFSVELPPGWHPVRTGAHTWQPDIEELLATLTGRRRPDARTRREMQGFLEEVVMEARAASVALMALSIESDPRTGLQLGSITVAMAGTEPANSSIEMCLEAVSDQTGAHVVETGAGAAVVVSAAEKAANPVTAVVADGLTSRSTIYLPVAGRPWTMVCAVQMSGRRRLALTRTIAERIAGSFELVVTQTGPSWAGRPPVE